MPSRKPGEPCEALLFKGKGFYKSAMRVPNCHQDLTNLLGVKTLNQCWVVLQERPDSQPSSHCENRPPGSHPCENQSREPAHPHFFKNKNLENQMVSLIESRSSSQGRSSLVQGNGQGLGRWLDYILVWLGSIYNQWNCIASTLMTFLMTHLLLKRWYGLPSNANHSQHCCSLISYHNLSKYICWILFPWLRIKAMT